MAGRIYISVVIGDACGHRRICSPDHCSVDTSQLCTADVQFIFQWSDCIWISTKIHIISTFSFNVISHHSGISLEYFTTIIYI